MESSRSTPRSQQALEWLLKQQISRRGDWAETVAAVSGGWCFEHANEFYPDIDDTIMVLMALRTQFDRGSMLRSPLPADLCLVDQRAFADRRQAREHLVTIDRVMAASRRGLEWVMAMQNRDGGWGAFDRDNDSEFLCHVPFADHNAMIDPSTPDLTGRVLEMLAQFGRHVGDPIGRSSGGLHAGHARTRRQLVRPLGRELCVRHLAGAGRAGGCGRAARTIPMIAAAVKWLLDHQQADGGWGESPDSYADPSLRGQGPTTASQTAWAVLGLIAAGQHAHPDVARGVEFLIERQRADGTWDESEFTGTGFPLVFYLRYHLYPIYFPLLALSQWAMALGETVTDLRPLDWVASGVSVNGAAAGR